jgi:hypothetical protein
MRLSAAAPPPGAAHTQGMCVVHIVWAPLGPQLLERFLASYRRHAAGEPHRLLMLFNGFSPGQDLAPWRELLADVEHEELRLQRPVIDLAAYREATARAGAERYCFLNSSAVLLADGWLAHLTGHLRRPGVGLVGATGSWGSVRSHLQFKYGLGGPYARVFADRREAVAAVIAAGSRSELETPPPADGPRPAGGRRRPLRYARTLLEQAWGFRSFPAPHIRTNGFAATADVLARVRMGRLETKMANYGLESGRDSLTAQVQAMGLTPVVVARDGSGYAAAEWPASRTFWQGDQENLLIADNRTEDYQLGSPAVRETLSRFAWGPDADPRPASTGSLGPAGQGG